MSRMLRGFVADETGQDLVEYALLASFLAIVSIATLKLLGNKLGKSFAQVSKSL